MVGNDTRPASSRSRREQRREETIIEIKQRARQLLATHGYGGLSLRQVARDMRMSSPAIYHYFANQSDLITALCVDAFTAAAEAVENACMAYAAQSPREQMSTAFSAIRTWALQNPADFALTFGTPIPGYEAPPEVTGPPSVRLLTAIGAPYLHAVAEGRARPRPLGDHSVGDSLFAPHTSFLPDTEASPDAVAAVYNASVAVLGFVASESWGGLRASSATFDTLFEAHLATVLDGLGFTS